MTTTIVVEIIAVLVAWTLTAYLVWRWGPGLRKRDVYCPKARVRARIVAEQREAEFACLRVVDVRACSLVPSQSLTCERECVAHQ